MFCFNWYESPCFNWAVAAVAVPESEVLTASVYVFNFEIFLVVTISQVECSVAGVIHNESCFVCCAVCVNVPCPAFYVITIGITEINLIVCAFFNSEDLCIAFCEVSNTNTAKSTRFVFCIIECVEVFACCASFDTILNYFWFYWIYRFFA